MMTSRQKLFVAAYLKTGNATKAAESAGYSPHSAKQQGSRLLSYASVRQALEQRTEKVLAKAAMEAEEILERASTIARTQPEAGFKGTDVVNSLKLLADARKLTSKHDQGNLNVQVNIGFLEQPASPPDPPAIAVTAERVE